MKLNSVFYFLHPSISLVESQGKQLLQKYYQHIGDDVSHDMRHIGDDVVKVQCLFF